MVGTGFPDEPFPEVFPALPVDIIFPAPFEDII